MSIVAKIWCGWRCGRLGAFLSRAVQRIDGPLLCVVHTQHDRAGFQLDLVGKARRVQHLCVGVHGPVAGDA